MSFFFFPFYFWFVYILFFRSLGLFFSSLVCKTLLNTDPILGDSFRFARYLLDAYSFLPFFFLFSMFLVFHVQSNFCFFIFPSFSVPIIVFLLLQSHLHHYILWLRPFFPSITTNGLSMHEIKNISQLVV